VSSAPAYAVPRLLSLGDSAWTVEFGAAIAPELRDRVLGLCHALDERQRAGGLDGVVEWVPTFRSVTVHFDPRRCDAEALGRDLAALAATSGSLRPNGTLWRLPVCFDPACAPDLAEVAAARGLTSDEVVRLLTATEFTVYMLGFLPGFPYLGGLPEALEMPRLATPRKAVPARSVAIAGRMCAAYPWESPGGWRLVGRTPVRLFDAANAQRPALLAPGDRVRWLPIDRAGFEQLEREAAAGRLDPERLRDPGEPA
jgi:KipI family sensor histidine kinase inhibitor